MSANHFSVFVFNSTLDSTIKFLETSLAHLSFKEFFRPVPYCAGLGAERPYLWMLAPQGISEEDEKKFAPIWKQQHIAFDAKNGEEVRAFHAAALKAGGICNGPPGLRPQYHPHYYAAFVRDPGTGINWEVVCHKGDV